MQRGAHRRGGGLRKIKETLPDTTWHSATPHCARGHGGGLTENGECLHDLNVFAPAFKALREGPRRARACEEAH